MSYPIIDLKSGKDRQIRLGHPWIFSGAIRNIPEGIEPGSPVRIKNSKKKFIGTGYYNAKSQICVRMLSRDPEVEINGDFIKRRIQQAYDRRKPFFDENATNAFRLVHAEADSLPGIIVDKYADFFVIQCHTLGAEKLKGLIVEALTQLFSPTGIYEKSEILARKHEGLDEGSVGVLAGQEPPDELVIMENGLRFRVNLKEGQKTGFFIDQRENRQLIRRLAAGRKVLNLFSFSGAGSVAALAGGAAEVTSVDIDEAAIALIDGNIEENGLDQTKHKSIVSDVNKYLNSLADNEEHFDLIILDPPAFAKHKSAIKKALRGYQDLNAKTMRNLAPEGFLLTCSCSGLVTSEDFRNVIMNSARDINQPLIELGDYPQPFDHPTTPVFQEGRYLKSFLLQLPERI